MVIAQGALGYGLTSVIGAIPAEIFEGKHYGAHLRHADAWRNRRRRGRPVVPGAPARRDRQLPAGVLLALVLLRLSAVAIWLAAPRKVRVVPGRVAKA